MGNRTELKVETGMEESQQKSDKERGRSQDGRYEAVK